MRKCKCKVTFRTFKSAKNILIVSLCLSFGFTINKLLKGSNPLRKSMINKYPSEDKTRYSCGVRTFENVAGKELNATENIGAITMYGWDKDDFCLSTKQDLLWNPLFPRYPTHKQVVHQVEDLNTITNFAIRRFLFYLSVPLDSHYFFQITVQGGIIFYLQEYIHSNAASNFEGAYILQVQKDQINEQESFTSNLIYLRKNALYLVDLIHWIRERGRLKMEWKTLHSSRFESIDESCISAYRKIGLRDYEMPKLPENVRGCLISRRGVDPKLQFYRRKQISLEDSKVPLASCRYLPSYIVKRKVKRYEGWRKVREGKFHPDFTLLKHKQSVVLSEEVASRIGKEVFHLIKRSFCKYQKCKLDRIVFVEENDETKRGKRYFVELDIINRSNNQTLRFSDYFYKQQKKGFQRICTLENFRWQRNVTIYMVFTTSQNNKRWALIMLDQIANILRVIGDQQVHVVLVDFSTQDVDFHKEFQRRNLPYTLINIDGHFNKVKGLNKGARIVPYGQSIVLTMDLQLQLPPHFFDEVRKSTIPGKTVYAPVLVRMPCGIHVEYTEPGTSKWVVDGFGILAMYKVDWDKIGGMNEVLYGEKWGGEDWEIMDRIVGMKYEVIRRRIPGYYHIYHSRKGSAWYKSNDCSNRKLAKGKNLRC